MIPQQIGKYEIISELGKGSMGVVYQARDPEIGRLVAIKTLRTIYLGDGDESSEAMKRFRTESRSAGRLRHPNIVTIFEAGRGEDGSPFIVMEYIEGKSFEQLVRERGAIPPHEVVHYLAQVASAMDYAHSQTVIHRDIKPSNVIVDRTFKPHLLDFGVAKLSDTSVTPAGTVVGTPSYMSPEQIKGLPLTGASDLFALAVVAFEMFTGSRPFPGKDFTTVVNNIIHKTPLSFQELRIALPEGCERLLLRGLAKEVGDRPRSCLEFVDQLGKVFGLTIDGTGILGGFNPDYSPPTIGVAAPMAVMQAKVESVESKAPLSTAGVSPQSAPSVSEDSTPTGLRNLGFSTGPKTSPLAAVSLPLAAVSLPLTAVSPPLTAVSPPVGAGASSSIGGNTGSGSEGSAKNSVAATQSNPSPEKSGTSFGRVLGFLVAFALFVGGVLVGVLFLFPQDNTSPDTERAQSADDSTEETGREESADELPGENQEIAAPTTPASVVEPTNERPADAPVSSPEVKARPPAFGLDGLTPSSTALLDDGELLYVLQSNSLKEELIRAALDEAGKRSGGALTQAIGSLTTHQSFIVRINALKSLSGADHLKQPETRIRALQRLNDGDFLVRGFAAKVILQLAGQQGSAELKSALEERLQREDNDKVRQILSQGLSKLTGLP